MSNARLQPNFDDDDDDDIPHQSYATTGRDLPSMQTSSYRDTVPMPAMSVVSGQTSVHRGPRHRHQQQQQQQSERQRRRLSGTSRTTRRQSRRYETGPEFDSGSDNTEPEIPAADRTVGVSRAEVIEHPVRQTEAIAPTHLGLAPELGTKEVFSFIVNKMIGSGIVTGPAQVLFLTKNKQHALALWAVGFVYTIVSVVLYVEFGYRYPVTGGELVYLDELLPSPRLLMVAIFSVQFILFWNTATNCIHVARQILVIANLTLDSILQKQSEEQNNSAGRQLETDQGPGSEPTITSIYDGFDSRQVGFMAFIVLCFICLLHYFSRTAGRITNIALALFKLVMVLVLVFEGVVYAVGSSDNKGSSDWPSNNNGEPNEPIGSYASALFLILFAFQGWENASFVAGEVDKKKQKALKRGYYWAVGVVGVLYLLVNATFLSAFPYRRGNASDDNLIQRMKNDGFAAQYQGPDVKSGTVKAWAAVLAISAFGNVLAVTYTCGRVKQMIGQAYLFPWSKIWAQESRFNTPSGGLILHCICSWVLIVVGTSVNNSSLPGALQSYSHAIMSLAVTFAYCRFKPDGGYQWSWMKYRIISWLIIAIAFASNLAMIIVVPMSGSTDGNIDGKAFAATCFSAVAFSLIYYISLFPTSKWDPSPQISSWRKLSILRLIGVTWKIEQVDDDTYGERWKEFKKTTRYLEDPAAASRKEAFQSAQQEQFGESRQMVYYTLENSVDSNGDQVYPGLFRKLLFWFFGGDFSSKTYPSPIQDIVRFIDYKILRQIRRRLKKLRKKRATEKLYPTNA